MKRNLTFCFKTLLIITICCLNISCLTVLGRQSILNFDTSALPEQDKGNSYMGGEVGVSQPRLKISDKPLIYLMNYCSKMELISFAPSILIYLPPVIPLFFISLEDNVYADKFKLYFTIVNELESDYIFNPKQFSLILENPKQTLRPEKTETESEPSETVNRHSLVSRKQTTAYTLHFDIKCQDLEKGILVIEGLSYKDEPLRFKPISFQRETGLALAWGMFTLN